MLISPAPFLETFEYLANAHHTDDHIIAARAHKTKDIVSMDHLGIAVVA